MEEVKAKIVSNSSASVRLVPYGKGFVVVGNTYPHRTQLKELKGIFRKGFLVDGERVSGWLFSPAQYEKVAEFVESLPEGQKVNPNAAPAISKEKTPTQKSKTAQITAFQAGMINYFVGSVQSYQIINPQGREPSPEITSKSDMALYEKYGPGVFQDDSGSVLLIYTWVQYQYVKMNSYYIKSNKYDDNYRWMENKEPEGEFKPIKLPKRVFLTEKERTPYSKQFEKNIFNPKVKNPQIEKIKALLDSKTKPNIALAQNLAKSLGLDARGPQVSVTFDTLLKEGALGKLTLDYEGDVDKSVDNSQEIVGELLSRKGDTGFLYDIPKNQFLSRRSVAMGHDMYDNSRWSRLIFGLRDAAPKYIDLNLERIQPEEVKTLTEEEIGQKAKALAEKYRKKAESLRKKADSINDRLKNKITNTPKRQREYDSASIEADKLSDEANIMEAFAWALDNDEVPQVLKKMIEAGPSNFPASYFVRGAESTGYYSIVRQSKFPFEMGINLPSKKELGLIVREDYEKAHQAILELIRKANGGQVPESNDTEKEIKRRINDLKFLKMPGFFPTPYQLSEVLIREANIQPGDRILEPSAGIGALADVIREKHPDNPLVLVEQNLAMAEILKLKGYDVHQGDFLEYNPGAVFDKIIMNPPFEKGQDIDHVRHAYKLLKPGGLLVSVMSATAYSPNDRRQKWADFAEFVDEQGTVSKRMMDAFAGKDAFKQTGVSIIIVTLFKPEEADPTPSPSPASLDFLRRKLAAIDLLLEDAEGEEKALLQKKRKAVLILMED